MYVFPNQHTHETLCVFLLLRTINCVYTVNTAVRLLSFCSVYCIAYYYYYQSFVCLVFNIWVVTYPLA